MSRQPDNDRGRPGEKAASNVNNGDTATISRTTDHRADAMRDNLLMDVMQEGHRAYWLRRARQFDAAKPQPGEFHGNATREELREQWRRLDEIARACRARAEVCDVRDLAESVRTVLQEVA